MKPIQRQAGLTLVELMVAVMVLALLSVVVSPILGNYVGSLRLSYRTKQELVNRSIGAALLTYAYQGTARGQLPPPYSGGKIVNAVLNPSDNSAAGIALRQVLVESGVNPAEIVDDNYPAKRTRVYQLVNELNQTVPLYFRSGPSVDLTYQYGVVYTTNCSALDPVCNPGSPVLPGESKAMNVQNYRDWRVGGGDLAPAFVSTLALQKQMLATTANRLDRIRDAMLSYYRASQQTASGDDTTNWWLPVPGTKSASDVTANHQCWDGWYDLDEQADGVLAGVGLSIEEFGKTAWGGVIQYCRDYAVNKQKAANSLPHYAAIRIHRNVTAGIGPDDRFAGNNIVLTF